MSLMFQGRLLPISKSREINGETVTAVEFVVGPMTEATRAAVDRLLTKALDRKEAAERVVQP